MKREEPGVSLKRMRKNAHFTQEKVCEIMPWWSVRKLSFIENGHQEPTYREYCELAEFYQNAYRVCQFTFPDGFKPAVLK